MSGSTSMYKFHNGRGYKHWFNDKGIRHRIGGPAIEPAHEYDDESRVWYYEGKIHRFGEEDQPAIVTPYVLAWMEHGKLNRNDGGPVIMFANGTKIWKVGNNSYEISENQQPRTKTDDRDLEKNLSMLYRAYGQPFLE